MSVFNYFSQIITGYQSKKRTIGGIQVHYKFSGKAILFDPIEMLRNLRFKISESENSSLNLSQSIKNIDDVLLKRNELQKATVIASFMFEERKVKVVRYVKTVGNMPISRYDFFLDSNLFSVFQRQYDYGKGFTSVLQKMEPYGSKPQTQNDNSYYWADANSERAVLLEKFGHTQIWLIYDSNCLKDVWKNFP
jgi:hypothetical protein